MSISYKLCGWLIKMDKAHFKVFKLHNALDKDAIFVVLPQFYSQLILNQPICDWSAGIQLSLKEVGLSLSKSRYLIVKRQLHEYSIYSENLQQSANS